MLVQQLMSLISMLLVGLLGALVYDIYRAFHQLMRLGKKGTFIGDILYALVFLVFFLLVLLNVNNGELRSYIYLGVVLGYLLYFWVGHRLLRKPIYGLAKAIYWFMRMIFWPWRWCKKRLILTKEKIKCRIRQYHLTKMEDEAETLE